MIEEVENCRKTMLDWPRMFTVVRAYDPKGISGIGRVMDGIRFRSGKTVVHWFSSKAINTFDTFELFTDTHCRAHGGTTLIWLDTVLDRDVMQRRLDTINFGGEVDATSPPISLPPPRRKKKKAKIRAKAKTLTPIKRCISAMANVFGRLITK